jgi:Transcriptional regulator
MIFMNEMNLRSLDLNLLVVFEALVIERNTARAGERLGLSQPAVSHALRRLRAIFDDPLFVRAAHGLAPTSRTEDLLPFLRQALESTRALLAPRATFDPATSRRTFTLGMPDYAAYLLLPGLLERLRRAAPGITLLVRPVSHANALDLLENGRIDMVAGNVGEAGPPFMAVPLFSDELVCALRRDHPALALPWTPATFLELDHLNVSLAGELAGWVDKVLAERNERRKIMVTVGHFLLAPHLAATSDLIATEPRRILAPMIDRLGLVLRPVPFAVPGFSVSLVSHPRTCSDHGYLWLGRQIAEEADTAAMRH